MNYTTIKTIQRAARILEQTADGRRSGCENIGGKNWACDDCLGKKTWCAKRQWKAETRAAAALRKLVSSCGDGGRG